MRIGKFFRDIGADFDTGANVSAIFGIIIVLIWNGT